MAAEMILRRQDFLGEGMMWLEKSQQIAWVDILGKKLMIAEPDGTGAREYQQETEIGAVLPAADGRLVLVLRKDIVLFDQTSGHTQLLWSAAGQEPDTNRFNDAAIDSVGNLWVGSMDFDAEKPSGNLWVVTPEGTAAMKASGFRCLNGPVFSPDGRTMYLGDTMAGRVLAYDVDLTTAELANMRQFVDLNPFGGLPDGMAVDEHGNVWVCQITAGRIGNYAPDGRRIQSIALPVPIVTSCCFGGRDLSTLYATTARIILDDTELAAYPDSGSLFALSPGVRGLLPNVFGTVTKDM